MTSPASPDPPPGRFARRLLDGLLQGRQGPVMRWTRGQLDRRPSWAAYYSAQRAAERALTTQPLGAAQREQLLATIGAGPAAAPAAAPRWLTTWIPVTGGLATAAVLLVVLWPSPPTLTPRGDVDPLGVRVRCVDPGAGHVLAEAEGAARGSPAGAPVLRCPRDAVLWLSGTNGGTSSRQLFVVAVNAGGEPRWLAPFGSSSSSITLPPATYDQRLQTLARLSDLPVEEPLAVFALFTEAALTSDDVRRALEQATRGGLNSAAVARLPIAAEQARLTLVLGPAGDGGPSR